MKKIGANRPGVYLFKDKKGKVLYVGKAANLKSRLNSYFRVGLAPRQEILMREAKSLETIEVDSETEALILEANLIKKYYPDFNVQLKDDKDYLYLKIVKEAFPRVLLARKKGLVDAQEYFGPYPSARSLRVVLRSLRKVFPFRTSCKPGQGRACFFYHLGLCPGVCTNQISEKDYKKNISKLKLFFEGNKNKLVRELKKEMQTYSSKLEYEKAEETRRKIEAVNFVTRPRRRIDEYLEASSIKEIRQKELQELAQTLGMKTYLRRIECYDISNFQGSFPVGSMVVLTDGEVDRGQYRRFKIKGFSSPNDPGMMGEVIRRRLKNEWAKPDLIIVDGGKTQLGAAKTEIENAGLAIPVIGLAKRNEEIHLFETTPLRLPKDSGALYLITRIRDEAHRFAISFYRKLSTKAALLE
ncbi:MAG: excinuclease ABC subunit UvrC [bacterium]|nr:excinuclease ABC subunit UvrC [bacterium]